MRPRTLGFVVSLLVALSTGSPLADVRVGTYNGNGSSQSIGSLPWRPEAVIVKGETNEVAVMRSDSMVGDASKPLVGASALISGGITSLDAFGFSVGSDASVNDSGVTYHWVAFEAEPSMMDTGSYTGDGSSNRVISFPGFPCNHAVVMSASGDRAVHSTPTSNRSYDYETSEYTDAIITPLPATGFRIGDNDMVNKSGATYHYACWQNVFGRQRFASWFGDGSDNRERVIGFRPEYVFVNSITAAEKPTQRFRTIPDTTDQSLYFESSGTVNNHIQEILGNGIEVGDDDEVNKSGEGYAYFAWAPPGIGGRVFEDADFAGTAGDWDGGAGDHALVNVDVELYTAADAFVMSTVTDSQGQYIFAGIANGAYKVRARSATIGDADTSPKGTFNGCVPASCAYPLAEMTWGAGAALYAGQNAAVDDTTTGDNAGPGDSWASVSFSGSDVVANLGFAFNLIVNTVDDANAATVRSHQGSLRQFIKNANAIGSTGTTAGSSEFRIPTSDSGYTVATGVFTISSVALLPAMTDANTTIDGTTQTTNIGNTNLGISGTGLLGAGGTVGLGADGVAGTADESALSQVEAPEIEIRNLTNIRTGLDAQANDITIRGISIHGFGQNTDADVDGNIRVGLDGSTDYTGTLIEKNVIGASAFEFVLPPIKTDGEGLIVRGADGGILRNNLIGFHHRSGIKAHDGVTGWLIEDNEFRENGTTTRYGDAVDLGYVTDTATISQNLMVDNGASGVDSYESNGSNTITNNTITGNGFAGQTDQETSGIRLFGTDNDVTLNLIENNFGAGVLVVGDGTALNQPSPRNRISSNAFSGNGSNSIDLLADSADRNFGDGITLNGGAPNACSYLTSTGNDGIEYPVISSADLAGGTTTIAGQACPSSEIEVYRALAGTGDTSGGSDYGEGERYLGSTTTDGAGDFTFVTTALTAGDAVTAIVIDASDNTSEFGPNVSVGLSISGTVFEDVNYGGGGGRDLATASADAPSFTVERGNATVELYDAAGNFLGSTVTAVADGTYSFTSLPPAVYTVRVVNDTVTSSRPGSDGSELGVQVYRMTGNGEPLGAGAKKVGGELPSNEDAAVNSGAQTLPSLQGTDLDTDGVPEWTQSIVEVDLSGGAGSGVDFGFNFDVVVNTNNAGQGSLRQFILNSNLLN